MKTNCRENKQFVFDFHKEKKDDRAIKHREGGEKSTLKSKQVMHKLFEKSKQLYGQEETEAKQD